MYDFSYTAEKHWPINILNQWKTNRKCEVLQVSWHNVWWTFNMEKSHYHDNKLSHMTYGLLLWGNQVEQVSKLQKKSIRLITGSEYLAHSEPLFNPFKAEYFLKYKSPQLSFFILYIQLYYITKLFVNMLYIIQWHVSLFRVILYL